MRTPSRTLAASAFVALLASVLVIVPADPAAAVPPPVGIITTIGGGGGGDGNPALGTRMRPQDVDVDSQGNLYVADEARIRRIDAATGIITTVAGTGETGFAGDGGPATQALLGESLHLALDPENDDLYVSDRGSHRVRKVDAATGIITTVAGTGVQGFSGDGGPAVDAMLARPADVAVMRTDDLALLFVADWGNRRVRMIRLESGDIYTVAGNGGSGQTGDGGAAVDAEIGNPIGVGVGPERTLYIGTGDGGRVRKVNRFGFISTVLVTTGRPEGIDFDGAGNAFVSDYLRDIVYRLTPGGGVSVYAGTADVSGFSGDGGPAASAMLDNPRDVATDGAGNVYIASIGSGRIRKVTAATGIITTFAGGGVDDGGPATNAAFGIASDVAVDSAGNAFVADSRDHRVRRIDAATGIITTIAGTGVSDYSGDGGPATAARLDAPASVTIGPGGDLYVSDYLNYRVRRIDAATGIITTVVGTGTYGFSGDGGQAVDAQIDGVYDLAFDDDGNLYLADNNNHRIRRVTPGGIITTVAGNGGMGQTGDGGPATAAEIGMVVAITVDRAGRLFLASEDANVIRVVDRSGVIHTLAGTNGVAIHGGDGGPAIEATLGEVSALVLEPSGAVVFADREFSRVRRIDFDGNIDTIVGTGEDVDAGDGGPATAASMYHPSALEVSPAGDLYVVNRYRVRRVDYSLCAGYWVSQMGSPASDTLPGTAGRDVIHGGGGDDEIRGLGGNDVVCGGDGDDLLLGGPGRDILDGGDGNDKLRGAAGDDILQGGPGSDRLLPDTGNDAVDGGPGSDIVDYLAADGPIEADLLTGRVTYRPEAGGTWTATLRLIEKVDGTRFGDTLIGDDRRNVLRGKQGIDQIWGYGGDDDLIGGIGTDTLRGGDGGDLLKGQADDDVLRGDNGDDRLVGGHGDDTLLGGSGNDTLIGGLRVHRGLFSNTMDGGAGIDACRWSFDSPINCEP